MAKVCTRCGSPRHRSGKTGVCGPCFRNPTGAEGLAVTGDTATLTKTTGTAVRSLKDLIRVCAIDTTEWTVTTWTANTWSAPSGGQTLYQIKATLARRRAVLDAKAEIAALVKAAKVAPRPRPIPRPSRRPTSRLLEVAIPDLHLGKLAHGEETGHADYDLKIAVEAYRTAVGALLAKLGPGPFDQIVLPVGNDLLHSDTKHGTTTKGTPLDMDSRYHKLFRTARELICETVERLRTRSPKVHLVIVTGNHAATSEWALGDSIAMYFRSTPGVTVDNAPTSRKYLRFGRVGLMWTHGDKSKPADYPLLFATEAPDIFGRTDFREVHLGHLHQSRVTEYHGVRVRVSPALCPPDAWHAEHGFTSLRGAEAYVWDAKTGLSTVVFHTLAAPRRAS